MALELFLNETFTSFSNNVTCHAEICKEMKTNPGPNVKTKLSNFLEIFWEVFT